MTEQKKLNELINEWEKMNSSEVAVELPSRIHNNERDSIAKATQNIVSTMTEEEINNLSDEDKKSIEDMKDYLQKMQ